MDGSEAEVVARSGAAFINRTGAGYDACRLQESAVGKATCERTPPRRGSPCTTALSRQGAALLPPTRANSASRSTGTRRLNATGMSSEHDGLGEAEANAWRRRMAAGSRPCGAGGEQGLRRQPAVVPSSPEGNIAHYRRPAEGDIRWRTSSAESDASASSPPAAPTTARDAVLIHRVVVPPRPRRPRPSRNGRLTTNSRCARPTPWPCGVRSPRRDRRSPR